MATTVQEVLKRVRFLIQDLREIRWTSDELLLWLNDGQRAIVTFKPDAYTTLAATTLVAGAAQALAADAVQLIDVPANSTGTRRAIRPVKRRVLDAEDPAWRSAAQSGVIKYFIYDSDNPTRFLVYPPATVGTQVDVLAAFTPPTVTLEGSIGIGDVYVSALVDYICYRCYAKDVDYNPSAERAKLHYEGFYSTVTGKQMAEESAVPAPATGEPPSAV